MFEHKHIICTEADEEIYLRQCAALEKHIPGLAKLEEIRDVDSSRIQRYMYGDKEIVVINDIEAGLVRLNSEIPLEPFFEKNKKKQRHQRNLVSVTEQNAPETQLA